ncbi:hypothetical protein [Alienimonas chondri]|uniref:Chromosome partition protein Smc n=1 Tax=Alienimonas chondri TaxID=2681879 RepID=A0ABX1VEL6_9PLAN|nr:hypothetical protein [Alienimonas chondri]NNJ26426.1 hypothetical protein [Alienimonas chondri]
MTLFGKILIGLILALSLVFASLSAAVYSAQFNYREALADAKTQLEAKRVEAEDLEKQLRTEIGDLQAELATATDERDRQTNSATTLAEQKRLLEAELASTRTALDAQTALVKIAQEDSDDRRAEVLAGRERTADLSEKFVASEGEIAGLVDELFSKTVANTQMAQTNNRLLDQVGALKQQLRSLGIEPSTDPSTTEPAPDVDGKVLAVEDRNSAGTKVAISLGSDDGLRVGDELEVIRTGSEGKYIGRIRLTEVEYDLAIGNVIMKSPTATIKKGDDVKTRL